MIPLSADTEAQMEPLRRVLAWGDHFRLILVSAAAGPARDELLRRLRGWSGRDGIPRLEELHLAAVERPVAVIREVAEQIEAGAGIVLTGMEPYLTPGEQASPAIQELNFFRDELPELLPAPLVLVAEPEAITTLLGLAPDFVSVRAFSLDVELAAPP